MTSHDAIVALSLLGISVDEADIELVRREDKWLAFLPDHRLACFAESPAARRRMALERRVLRLLEARCRFSAPRVLVESPDESVDVRSLVPGVHDTEAVYVRLRYDPAAAAAVGAVVGAMIAELHTCVSPHEVADWLPRSPSCPGPRATLRERLELVTEDADLRALADGVLARFEEALEGAREEDRVLVHSDLGLHNLSIDPASLRVHGIFDWADACWSDRHLDFRYLIFTGEHDALLDAAIAAYEPATGRRISRDRVHLHNAAAAIGFLADRAGVPAETRWCGRTLAEDMAWTRKAIARVEPTSNSQP